jgi:site-specific DNA-methyltransferase (adenine-specific)
MLLLHIHVTGASYRQNMIELDSATSFVVEGDCESVLPKLPDGAFQLIYVDPPFNTGKLQERRTLRTERSADGDRVGFGGRSYSTTELSKLGYMDAFDDYLAFLGPKLEEARRLLSEDGTLFVHLDHREVHYVKVFLDMLFGRDAFLNEIIWAYDYGGRKRDRWPEKHDTILAYVKSPGSHFFSQDQIERIPYMAPGLVTAEKRDRGKLPTDVWWHTIVPTNGKEKTGYPNQKPEGVLKRVVEGSSAPGARVLDFFAGSGTTGAVARQMGRQFVLIDSNPEAIAVMRRRLGASGVEYVDEKGSQLQLEPPEGEAPQLF